MSIIWITHDLSLLAGMVDRIMVMYGGSVVEEAPLDEIYKSPRHPYTIGLLKSIPSIKTEAGSRLPSIAGAPPNLFVEPQSCPFAPPLCLSQGTLHQRDAKPASGCPVTAPIRNTA